MIVKILEPKGYCGGVNNAINIAIKAKKENPNLEIYVLGMLVHNDFVVRSLESQGIHTIYQIDDIPDGQVIVFTAHGHDKKLDQLAKSKNLVIYDAVCPIVQKNLSLIDSEIKEGHQAIYIGIASHPETIAALSLSRDVLLYPVKGEFDFNEVKDESPLVVNQTTLNILELGNIHQEIRENVKKARIADEICSSTRTRQEAIKNLDSKDVDLIIVVGDQKSSNSLRLFEVAKLSHPEIDSVMISDASQLDVATIKHKKSIVIASGASVAHETIDAVCYKINSLN